MKPLTASFLALCVGRRREGIRPAQAIPVGDVFAHAHDELTGVAILSVDLLKKGVGQRATGASLGREEFHEDGAMPRLHVIPVQVS
jgi:hypothetical protein